MNLLCHCINRFPSWRLTNAYRLKFFKHFTLKQSSIASLWYHIDLQYNKNPAGQINSTLLFWRKRIWILLHSKRKYFSQMHCAFIVPMPFLMSVQIRLMSKFLWTMATLKLLCLLLTLTSSYMPLQVIVSCELCSTIRTRVKKILEFF